MCVCVNVYLHRVYRDQIRCRNQVGIPVQMTTRASVEDLRVSDYGSIFFHILGRGKLHIRDQKRPLGKSVVGSKPTSRFSKAGKYYE